MVTLGIDAHKRTHTVVGVDAVGQELGQYTTTATTSSEHLPMLRWTERFGSQRIWRWRTAGADAIPTSTVIVAVNDFSSLPEPREDPVLVRRRRIARRADLAQRVGYVLFGVAIVAFLVGFAVGFRQALVTTVLVALALGSVFLAPAIVFGYAVRAAEREDRERGLNP
jgi:hypothetical protein